MTNPVQVAPAAHRDACSRTWRAMGTTADVQVSADPGIAGELVDLAVRRVGLLESTWSRFRPASELNRLNARAGQGEVAVSDDLLILVTAMVEGWHRTAGLFDPTVLAAMRAHGYDRDFADVIVRDFVASAVPSTPTTGLADVVIDPHASTITLPAGIGIDPGAIGKGLAADLIVDELLGAGAEGVLVSLGGDIAFAGTSPDGGGWAIEVADERALQGGRGLAAWVFEAARGGVATSTTRKRRWANGTRHHVIDPRTGTMASSDVLQATVIAERAWIAETSATAALVHDSSTASDWLHEQGLLGLIATDHEVIDLVSLASATTRTSKGTDHA